MAKGSGGSGRAEASPAVCDCEAEWQGAQATTSWRGARRLRNE